jgi:hypothetical protein
MAKLSKEERAELEARLAADDDDDDDDEVELTFNGTTLRGSFRRIAAFAAANGLKLKADPTPPAEGEEGGGTVKRFAGRRIS